jgi:hypothetical protein
MAKRIMRITAVLLVVVLLAGCNSLEPDPEVYTKEALTAMAAEDFEAAAELMHPSKSRMDAQTRMKGLSQYVKGRQITKMEKVLLESGGFVQLKEGEDRGQFHVELDDGTTFEVNYTFMENEEGVGFTNLYFTFGS